MRIVFMGTPDFAVASLKKLVDNGCDVVAVITAPDKPSGRGLQLNETPVKRFAVSRNIPVLQPEKLKNSEFLAQLRSYQADLQVVVAFRMLPEIVWAMPPKGTINLHGSLLPQYRGAAPINWAVINGEIETGVTTFFIQQEIDTGHIIFSEKTPILPEDNAGTIHDKLMEIGADLVLKTVRAIEKGNYPLIPQNFDKELKSAPKIFKETCEINWNQPADKIHNFIRGLSPYPTAWTTIHGKICKIYESAIGSLQSEISEEELSHSGSSTSNHQQGNPTRFIQIGDFYTDGKKVLAFKCQDKFLEIKQLQIEGKKRMSIEEFLRGFRFE